MSALVQAQPADGPGGAGAAGYLSGLSPCLPPRPAPFPFPPRSRHFAAFFAPPPFFFPYPPPFHPFALPVISAGLLIYLFLRLAYLFISGKEAANK